MAVLFADTFSAADGTPLIGNGWSAPIAAFSSATALINRGGYARGESTGNVRAVPTTQVADIADAYVQGVYAGTNLSSTFLFGRLNATSQTGYALIAYPGMFRVWRIASFGIAAIIGSVSMTISAGDTFRMECEGTTVRAYVNGTLRLTLTNQTISATGYWGLASNGINGINVLDNFELGDFTTVSTYGYSPLRGGVINSQRIVRSAA